MIEEETMATTVRPRTPAAIDNPAYQAYLILRTGFIVAPILFGLDKFTNLLTDWTAYLAPAIDRLVPGSASGAMLAVGVVEIVAGLVVAVRPKVGGYLVAAWLAGIIVNLLLLGDRYERGAGTFSNPRGRGYDLTLVEAEALEELSAKGVELAPIEARRNLVVRGIALDDLIGRRFRVGAVECFGQRRCEPCAHLQRLTRPGVLRGLAHRGGLRADVLSSGGIMTGDRVEALA
jgi:hypothetical protein